MQRSYAEDENEFIELFDNSLTDMISGEIFTNPVRLNCSCHQALEKKSAIKIQNKDATCPTCRKEFTSYVPDRLLKGMAEGYRKMANNKNLFQDNAEIKSIAPASNLLPATAPNFEEKFDDHQDFSLGDVMPVVVAPSAPSYKDVYERESLFPPAAELSNSTSSTLLMKSHLKGSAPKEQMQLPNYAILTGRHLSRSDDRLQILVLGDMHYSLLKKITSLDGPNFKIEKIGQNYNDIYTGYNRYRMKHLTEREYNAFGGSNEIFFSHIILCVNGLKPWGINNGLPHLKKHKAIYSLSYESDHCIPVEITDFNTSTHGANHQADASLVTAGKLRSLLDTLGENVINLSKKQIPLPTPKAPRFFERFVDRASSELHEIKDKLANKLSRKKTRRRSYDGLPGV